MILIEHTHQDGTTIIGTRKGDRAVQILKDQQVGWRWSPKLGVWYIKHSRDKDAQRWKINQTVAALRQAGYDVEVSIDNTRRDMGTQEAERAERAEGRADYYDTTGQRLQQRSDARWEHNQQRWEAIPPGQPIIGARDRNRREKLAASDRIAIRDQKAATHYAQRAQSARATQRQREDPRVTTRRIKRLKAKRTNIINQHNENLWWAQQEGTLTPEKKDRIEASRDRKVEEINEKITYWQQYLHELEESGAWRPWRPEHIQKGDRVLVSGTWTPVVRVNQKTVTVEVWHGERKMSWTTTVPYDQIHGRERHGHRITEAPTRTNNT